MFDYEKFENDVVRQMTEVFHRWTEENDDLYIFSLDCAREMDSVAAIANTNANLEEQADEEDEDYWYYKVVAISIPTPFTRKSVSVSEIFSAL